LSFAAATTNKQSQRQAEMKYGEWQNGGTTVAILSWTHKIFICCHMERQSRATEQQSNRAA